MTALEDVRDWVGSEPDDATVLAQLDRFADHDDPAARAALAILLRRQADAGPAKVSVAGDYSEDNSATASDLAKRIARLRTLCGEDVTATVAIVPPGPVTR